RIAFRALPFEVADARDCTCLQIALLFVFLELGVPVAIRPLALAWTAAQSVAGLAVLRIVLAFAAVAFIAALLAVLPFLTVLLTLLTLLLPGLGAHRTHRFR